MTKAAKAFGKDLSNFMRSPETLEDLDALANTEKSTEKEALRLPTTVDYVAA
ncbi:hypothetical protein GFL09_08495 [Pseudomonas stutzeri]|nr:hypothetical protein [Stutzerimonas stutzeri]